MKGRYLEVTFRRGKPFAAYLYLPRQAGAKSVRTEKTGNGLMVDYSANDTPIGIEITAPQHVTLDVVNQTLNDLGLDALEAEELAPLSAA